MNLIKLVLISLISILFLKLEAIAQKKPIIKTELQIRDLKIGDQVPDLYIAKIIKNQKNSAKISDFKDQLLILDFWDTYCSSCIEALPKMDSLQKEFGHQIKILPVRHLLFEKSIIPLQTPF